MIDAGAATLSPRRGMLNWLNPVRGPDAAAAAAGAAPAMGSMRMQVQQRLFHDIGEFLRINGLDSSPASYAAAHAHVWDGSCRDPAGMLRPARTPESDSPHDGLDVQRLAELVAELEDHLARCMSAMDRSHLSTATFSCALDEEAEKLRHDPQATLERIVALTRDAVHTTRLAERQLQQMRDETRLLRLELGDARRAAERDHLTGLPNRRFFEARMQAVLNDAGAPQAQVALCDIDDFKQINDRFGHAAGDRVLRYIADFLRSSLGPEVTLARYGGEEFACLFEGVSSQQACAMLDEARAALAARSLVNQDTGKPIGSLTFSAGIATLSPEGGGYAVQQADARLYFVKRNGKNAVIDADRHGSS